MIQLDNTITPDTYILETLKAYQQEIDALETFEQRCEKAKEVFSNRNKKGNKVFDAIKIS